MALRHRARESARHTVLLSDLLNSFTILSYHWRFTRLPLGVCNLDPDFLFSHRRHLCHVYLLNRFANNPRLSFFSFLCPRIRQYSLIFRIDMFVFLSKLIVVSIVYSLMIIYLTTFHPFFCDHSTKEPLFILFANLYRVSNFFVKI